MPITINGSGTVTGIITGGLPNGILINTGIASTAFSTTSEKDGVYTTGYVGVNSNRLSVLSTTNITTGMFVVGQGIAPDTTITGIAGTILTLSGIANTALSNDPVSFYVSNKLITPGVIAGQLCRAWVNFNGSGTVDIRAAYNVSSITDNGVGDYTANFSTAMSDQNYVIVGSSGRPDSYRNDFCIGPDSPNAPGTAPEGVTKLAGSCRFTTGVASVGVDAGTVNVAVFR